MFKSAVQKSVRLTEINVNDRSFKISRNIHRDTLKRSISTFGVLEPPVLLFEDDHYTILFGHNRLKVLQEIGQAEVSALIIKKIELDEYIEAALLKCIRNEAGPIGRIRLILLLKDYFNITPERLRIVVKQGLSISENLISDRKFLNAVNFLPPVLLDYIDAKNMSTRTIKQLLLLSQPGLIFMEKILQSSAFRVNYFTRIAEMLVDIEARDKTPALEDLLKMDDSNNFPSDKIIHERLYSLRYPNYIPYKKKAEKITEKVARQGIQIEYPPFFEGDTVSLTMTIQRNEDPALLQKKITTAEIKRIKDLLDML